MSVTSKLNLQFSDNGAAVSVTRALVTDGESVLDFFVPNNTSNAPASYSIVRSKARLILITSDVPMSLTAGGINAVQAFNGAGTVSGGTFSASFGGQTASAIPYNVTASALQTALAALSSIGAGNVACSGGPLPGTPIVVTFQGALAAAAQATITTDSSGLTGGGTIGVAPTTAGVAPDSGPFAIQPTVPFLWDYQGGYAQPFSADVSVIRVTNVSGGDGVIHLRTPTSA